MLILNVFLFLEFAPLPSSIDVVFFGILSSIDVPFFVLSRLAFASPALEKIAPNKLFIVDKAKHMTLSVVAVDRSLASDLFILAMTTSSERSEERC
jgi:hypothetical protein